MIGSAYTPSDALCLDGLVPRAAELALDPVVMAIARALKTPAQIVAWLCSLPQTNDGGTDWTPGAVACGDVWQRTRSPADAGDPNCWERLAWFAALMQVIRPDVEIRFSTWLLPGGALHVAPMLRAAPPFPGAPLGWAMLDIGPGAYPSLAPFVDLVRNAGPLPSIDSLPPQSDCQCHSGAGARNFGGSGALPLSGQPGYWYPPDSVVQACARAILQLVASGYPMDPRYVRAALFMVHFYDSLGVRNATTAQDFLGVSHLAGSVVLAVFGLGAIASLLGVVEKSQLPVWAGGDVDAPKAAAAAAPASGAASKPAPGAPASAGASSSGSANTTAATITAAANAVSSIAASFTKAAGTSSSSAPSSSSSSSSSSPSSSSPSSYDPSTVLVSNSFGDNDGTVSV